MPAPLSDNTEYIHVGLNCYVRAPNVMPRPHRHDEVELVYVKSGSVSYLFGGSKVTFGPRTLMLFWSGVPHQVVSFSSKAIVCGLELPLAWFLQWKMPEFLTQALLNGGLLRETDPRNSKSDFELLNRWCRDLATGQEELKKAVLLEIEARLWRFAEGNAAVLRTQSQGTKARRHRTVLGEGGLSRVEKLAQYIAENYTRPIKVKDVADVMDLHPDYAMKIFHKAFGTNLAEYLTQHRIFHAQRLLATSDAKIMDIALESGFGSLSRFNANFKEVCGISPKLYRRQMTPRA